MKRKMIGVLLLLLAFRLRRHAGAAAHPSTVYQNIAEHLPSR